MRQLCYAVAAVLFVVAFNFLSVACHNDGGTKKLDPIAGDNTPDTPGDGGGSGDGGGGGNGGDSGGGNGGGSGGGNGGGNGGGGGGSTDTRFVGTWITSFGDDLPVGTGRREYALRMAITRSNDTLTGNGSMVRFYSTGTTAFDEQPLSITASGTASANEATLTVKGTSNTFTNNPIWYLRIADTRLVGMYAERDINLIVQRSGHAIWYPAGSVDLSATWAAAFDDKIGVGTSFAARDRTALATLTVTNNAISGLGSYVEQRSNGGPEEYAFDVGSGALTGTQTKFSFLNFNPDNGEVDWFGYHSGGVIVAAYGQFNASSDLVRFGNASWYETSDTTPSDFDHTWTTAFGDSAAAGNLFADYVMQMVSISISGNTLTGTVRVLEETASQPSFVNYTIENGTIVGNRLTMDMTRNGVRFSWDMRLAGSILVGSYTHYDASDAYVSRGNAEWRYGSSANLPARYVAGYSDTSTTNDVENRASQLAVVTIDSEDSDGNIVGTGSVRLGGETNRRQFAIGGTVSSNGHIVMTWENGADLSGNTVWNLRKAGNSLYGTYTNYASDNATIEFQGHASFVAASGN